MARVTDIVPTLLELAGVEHPKSYEGREVAPLVGRSMLPLWKNSVGLVHRSDAKFSWELHGQKALITDHWKAANLPPPFGNAKWELYDLATDPGETTDLSSTDPERLKAMIEAYHAYADEVGVIPPDLDELLRSMGIELPPK